MWVEVKLIIIVAWIVGVAAYGTIPLRLIQMAPAHNTSANYFDVAMGFLHFEHEMFDDERALAFVAEHYPETELLSVYRGCARSLRSGLFRLATVSKLGGFYMEMAAGWPLEELAAHSSATFPKEWWKDDAAFKANHFRLPRDKIELWQVGNYAFGAAAGHQFVLDALEEAVRRCAALMAAKNASEITDLDVLRSMGSYMLSEVYHDGRLAGKYSDVDFVTGGSSDKQLSDRDSHKVDRSPAPRSTASPAPTLTGLVLERRLDEAATAVNYTTLLGLIGGGVKPIYTAATTIVFAAEITVGYNSDVEIIGDNSMPNYTVFDGAGSSRLFVVDGGRLKLRSLVFRNGHTTGNGGALSLLNGAFVEIFNCIVSGSSAVNGGGAAVDSGSTLVINGSSIGDNAASGVSSPASLISA